MQILLNGKRFATEAETSTSFAPGLGFADAKIATAVNGSFVAAVGAQEQRCSLEADEVEIVAPRQGG